ncbi:Uncharacterised protein r2_g2119 [Pycnogonum litorale]
METSQKLQNFVLAGMSSMMGAIVTNPIDVIKVRMQLEGELMLKGEHLTRHYSGFTKGFSYIVTHEGARGLYKGLVASLMREGSYSTIRIGAYEPMKELLGATDPAHTPLYLKVISGAITGAIGSAVANPTDLVKVRLQAEGALIPEQIPRYPSTFSAFAMICRTEGLFGLWRGVGPTVKRAALLTATQIPSYDHSKHFILNAGFLEEGYLLHVICSMFAGFMTATVTSPVDVIKTRVMNQKIDKSKPLMYLGTFDALKKIFKNEGIVGFYKGWFPNWMRIGPHTIVCLMFFEQLRWLLGIRPV